MRFGDRVMRATIHDGAHHQLVSGAWNATGVLLEAGNKIEATANRLPVRQRVLNSEGGSAPLPTVVARLAARSSLPPPKAGLRGRSPRSKRTIEP